MINVKEYNIKLIYFILYVCTILLVLNLSGQLHQKKNTFSINYVNILSGKNIYYKNIINCIRNKQNFRVIVE